MKMPKLPPFRQRSPCLLTVSAALVMVRRTSSPESSTKVSAADARPMTVFDPRLPNAIRALAMDSVERASSGHPGMPMGMADVATVLFTEHLKFDPTTTAVARSRPLRAVGWPRLDAALRAACT